MSTLTALRKKQGATAKQDSELFTRKLLELIDYHHQVHIEYKFTEISVKILCQAKQLVHRKDWLRLRRHILQKLEETK